MIKTERMSGDVIIVAAVRGDSGSSEELDSVRRTRTPSRQEAVRNGEDSFEH
jgi:hypothetical protein